SPWGSPIPIGYGDGDVNRFPDGDGDGDGDEAEKRGWGWFDDVELRDVARRMRCEVGEFSKGMRFLCGLEPSKVSMWKMEGLATLRGMGGSGAGEGDRRRWGLHENGDFTVRELTKLVEEKTLGMVSGDEATMWNK
ncbi:hypothetical protein Tco_0381911, partial [Tanacetum coccineum]